MTKLYRRICHTKCFKFDTLWDIGDIYEGKADPGKHFSEDGINPDEVVAHTSGDDPRSNDAIRSILERDYNVKMPKNAARKILWRRLYDLEQSASKDVLTDDKPEPPEIKLTKAPRRKKKVKHGNTG